MFTRVKPTGWASGEILTQVQMNNLDSDHADAIDGAGGGTYTPSAAIVIEGNDMFRFAGAGAQYTLSGSGLADGAKFTVSESFTYGGTFTIVSNAVRVPRAGIWQAQFTLIYSNSDNATNPLECKATLRCPGITGAFSGIRYSASSTAKTVIHGTLIAEVTTPASDSFQIEANTSGTSSASSVSTFSLLWLGAA